MPYTCCVPGCRGNYDAQTKVAVFSFPKDENLKKLWISSIPRKDYTYTASSRVCEKHFSIDEVQRITSACDEKTGEFVTAPLKYPRLKRDAVPTIFPECRKYRSMSSTTHHREAPTSRGKKRFKQEQMATVAVDSSQEPAPECSTALSPTVDDGDDVDDGQQLGRFCQVFIKEEPRDYEEISEEVDFDSTEQSEPEMWPSGNATEVGGLSTEECPKPEGVEGSKPMEECLKPEGQPREECLSLKGSKPMEECLRPKGVEGSKPMEECLKPKGC
ncbi:THAP domain-containing protein 11 [Nilaparvata lugens]|uniref:THAP domain-containing protein 11 n=1 Tax=Nilaparvata lugens TaxID=108931 RepID=UPI00193CC800|nr:THAP domain-containing protein 11 [Nilaparvata lugens]